MMKKIITYISAIIFHISVLSGFAQVDRTKLPAEGPAPVIKIGKYESFTMKNGMKIFVVQNKKLPRISCSMLLDYDPVLEEQFKGYVDISGQLLRNGTKSRTKSQLDEEIDFIGATLYTSANGV